MTEPEIRDAPEGENYIPLAPVFTSIAGLTARFNNGISASLRYRYLADRPANESNTVVANGYFLLDAVLKYSIKSFEVNITCENMLDTEWNEAQFDTESRLLNEPDPVSEIHFTPGTPLFLKAGVAFHF